MNNAVIRLFGNIGKIESQYTPTGKLVTKASLAVNHGWGDNKTTNWYNLTAWGGDDDRKGNAERMRELCEKGTGLFVEGKLLLREWTDRDGAKHLSPDVTVSEFRVMARGKKPEDSASPYDGEEGDLPDVQD